MTTVTKGRRRTRLTAYERACTQFISRGLLGASDEHVRAVLNGEKRGTPQLHSRIAQFLIASGAGDMSRQLAKTRDAARDWGTLTTTGL